MQSAERLIELLDLVAETAPKPVSATQGAARLSVNVSTAFRLFAVLQRRGYVVKHADRKYLLAPARIPLARGLIQRSLARYEVSLHRVAAACGQRAYLLGLHGNCAVVLGSSLGRNDRSVVAEEEAASTYALWATAAGHALLSLLRPVEQVAVLPQEPYPAFTPQTPTLYKELQLALSHVEKFGLARESGALSPTLACRALPLGMGELPMAMAVSFPVGTDPKSVEQALLQERQT